MELFAAAISASALLMADRRLSHELSCEAALDAFAKMSWEK